MDNQLDRMPQTDIQQDKNSDNAVGKGFTVSDRILRHAIKIVEAMARSFEPDPTLGNLFDKKVIPEIRKRLDSETNAKINKFEVRLDKVKKETRSRIWNLVKEANISGLEIGSYVEKAVDKIDYVRTMDKNKIETKPVDIKSRVIDRFKRLIGIGVSARKDAENMEILAKNNKF